MANEPVTSRQTERRASVRPSNASTSEYDVDELILGARTCSLGNPTSCELIILPRDQVSTKWTAPPKAGFSSSLSGARSFISLGGREKCELKALCAAFLLGRPLWLLLQSDGAGSLDLASGSSFFGVVIALASFAGVAFAVVFFLAGSGWNSSSVSSSGTARFFFGFFAVAALLSSIASFLLADFFVAGFLGVLDGGVG